MAKGRLSMPKIKEVLRLRFEHQQSAVCDVGVLGDTNLSHITLLGPIF